MSVRTPDMQARLDALADAALLEIMESGTISQRILILPLLVPRPLPEKPSDNAPRSVSVYFAHELDENGQIVELEPDSEQTGRLRRKEPDADGVTSYG